MKKSGRGSVGRMRRYRERYQIDEEFRKQKKEVSKKYYGENQEKIRERKRKWEIEISKFANRKCKKCNKLLHWKTKGDYCNKHHNRGRKKK